MKYPKTGYLPWSPKKSGKPERIFDPDNLRGKVVVYTEKLDGENTCIHRDGIHARSETGYGRPWQTRMWPLVASFMRDIPKGMYIYGENIEAVHSIEYPKAPTHFFVFGIYCDNNDTWLSWPDVEYWATSFGLYTVPLLAEGIFDTDFEIPPTSVYGLDVEGYVVRNISSFKEFDKNVAKCRYTIEGNEHWTKNWKPARIGG